ncbi:MAG: DUF1735 domain-containing protein [Chitinophagaceae bacterium]
MKLFNKTFYITMVTALTMLMFGCVKEDKFFDTGSGEQNRVMLKFLEAPDNKIFFEPFTDTKKAHLFSLRRDVNNSQDLNQTLTVNLTVDTAAIRAYNDENDETFKLLPDSLYTLVGNDFTKTGALTYQVTFAPGEISKEFDIMLNGAKWDPSEKYTIPFMIDNTPGTSFTSGKEMVNVFISITNKYDGVYQMKGFHNRDPYTFPYDETMYMITEGANSVVFYWPEAGSEGHPIGTGPGATSWYGTAIRPVVVFGDDDKVVDVYNKNGGTVITRFDGATGANVSRYDPATKTIIVHWNYANNPLRAFFDTLNYVGPRP